MNAGPVDISTFPKAFDTRQFTPREAEAYEAAWCDRRLAVGALAAAMRGSDDELVADLLGPALSAAARCNAIEEAAAERIRQEAVTAALTPKVVAGLVIGPPVDGDRASENDLAQRGAYDHAVDRLAEILETGGDCAAVAARAANVVQLHREQRR